MEMRNGCNGNAVLLIWFAKSEIFALKYRIGNTFWLSKKNKQVIQYFTFMSYMEFKLPLEDNY